jgi:hypothetical protein
MSKKTQAAVNVKSLQSKIVLASPRSAGIGAPATFFKQD